MMDNKKERIQQIKLNTILEETNDDYQDQDSFDIEELLSEQLAIDLTAINTDNIDN